MGVAAAALVHSCKTGCCERFIPGDVVLVVLLPIIVVRGASGVCVFATAVNGIGATLSSSSTQLTTTSSLRVLLLISSLPIY